MNIHLSREIKAYCPDFVPVRQLLRDLGAVLIGVKEQVDFFYHLLTLGAEEEPRRLKLRVENGERRIIYYYDRQEKGTRTSHFQIWEVNDLQVKEMLDTALGIRAIVRKQREHWRKENIVFNLDMVEDVGQIFEIEVLAEDGRDIEDQLAEHRIRLEPLLGPYIAGSNEDLVTPAA